MNSVEIGSLIVIGLAVMIMIWGQFGDDDQ